VQYSRIALQMSTFGAREDRAGGRRTAIATAPGAHHWRLSLLEIVGNGVGDIVTLGDGSSAQNSLAQVRLDHRSQRFRRRSGRALPGRPTVFRRRRSSSRSLYPTAAATII